MNCFSSLFVSIEFASKSTFMDDFSSITLHTYAIRLFVFLDTPKILWCCKFSWISITLFFFPRILFPRNHYPPGFVLVSIYGSYDSFEFVACVHCVWSLISLNLDPSHSPSFFSLSLSLFFSFLQFAKLLFMWMVLLFLVGDMEATRSALLCLQDFVESLPSASGMQWSLLAVFVVDRLLDSYHLPFPLDLNIAIRWSPYYWVCFDRTSRVYCRPLSNLSVFDIFNTGKYKNMYSSF